MNNDFHSLYNYPINHNLKYSARKKKYILLEANCNIITLCINE